MYISPAIYLHEIVGNVCADPYKTCRTQGSQTGVAHEQAEANGHNGINHGVSHGKDEGAGQNAQLRQQRKNAQYHPKDQILGPGNCHQLLYLFSGAPLAAIGVNQIQIFLFNIQVRHNHTFFTTFFPNRPWGLRRMMASRRTYTMTICQRLMS